MKKVINIVSGIILGLLPMIGAGIICFAIFASYHNVLTIILSVIILILSIWIGVLIFKKVQLVGPFELMAYYQASPDLDNLEPNPNSATKIRSVIEFVDLINEGKNLCKEGSIRIFGDWFEFPNQKKYEIQKASFIEEKDLLKLNFQDDLLIEIYNPKHLFETSTFFKIISADRIKISWYSILDKKQSNFIDYKRDNSKIITELKNIEHEFNTSPNENALMIFG